MGWSWDLDDYDVNVPMGGFRGGDSSDMSACESTMIFHAENGASPVAAPFWDPNGSSEQFSVDPWCMSVWWWLMVTHTGLHDSIRTAEMGVPIDEPVDNRSSHHCLGSFNQSNFHFESYWFTRARISTHASSALTIQHQAAWRSLGDPPHYLGFFLI